MAAVHGKWCAWTGDPPQALGRLVRVGSTAADGEELLLTSQSAGLGFRSALFWVGNLEGSFLLLLYVTQLKINNYQNQLWP